MKLTTIEKSEFNPYYQVYIDKVDKRRELLEALTLGQLETVTFFSGLTQEQWDLSYDIGKWTPREILLHLIDTERIFSYRALRFARNDTTPLSGFDQDHYVAESAARSRDSQSLIDEYRAVRESSVTLFKSLEEQRLAKAGTASGGPFSVRALGCIIAGHEIHHIEIIKERYL